MAYCLAVWCPHSAVSCPLVAVDDSLNSTFTPPPTRDWWVPTPRLVPPSKEPLTPLPTIWMPGTNNKGCPPVIRGCREKGGKVKDLEIPSDSPWSVGSNYSKLIFSAWLISKWIKCGPYYCRPGAPLKRQKEDQGCGLRCQSGPDPWG